MLAINRFLWWMFIGGEFPYKKDLTLPQTWTRSVDDVEACDLCADPNLFVRCLTHKLDVCWGCYQNHAKEACSLTAITPARYTPERISR